MRNRIIVAAIALVAVFLAGFIPQYMKAQRLEAELHQSRQENTGAELRDLIGLAYIQANQKNYGLAAETSGRFFTRTLEIVKQTTDASRRKALEDLLVSRDKVTADLAKADAGVVGDLETLFTRTRQATGSSSAP